MRERSELHGELPHDSAYCIVVPANWNGLLLNDLDYVDHGHGTPTRELLLDRGCALSGTRRITVAAYDIEDDVANQLSVLETFEREFGAPLQTLQIGCSRGAAVALTMAERYGDQIDGAIALCGQGVTVFSQVWLDLAVILKALLAPHSDLPVLPPSHNERARLDPAQMSALLAPWTETLTAARATPAGVARMALGLTLAQWPLWGTVAPSASQPSDAGDGDAILACAQEGVHTAVLFQNCAPQQVPC